MPREKKATTAPLPVFVRLFRVIGETDNTSKDKTIVLLGDVAITGDRTLPPSLCEMNAAMLQLPVLVYVSSDIDHREP